MGDRKDEFTLADVVRATEELKKHELKPDADGYYHFPISANAFVRGTYAERLAVARCSAEHALWALTHGADWKAGWEGCPRPHWLVEAYVLAVVRDGGGAEHRRLVAWIGAEVERAWTAIALRSDPQAKARVLRCTMAVRAATAFAHDWGTRRLGGPPDLVAFTVSSLFDQDEAGWTVEESRAVADRTTDKEARAVAHAALHAACSAISAVSPANALRALAWAHAGDDECPELARRFVQEFACPEAFRCDLPA